MRYKHTFSNVSSLFVGFVIVSTIFMGTQYAQAVVSNKLSKNNDLGNPFFVEHYQTELGKLNMTNNNASESFSGKGIINDTVDITADVNVTETFRDNDTSYLQGNTKYVTDNKDIASYVFYAIANYHVGGGYDSNGIAIFDDVATGNLSSLSNSVGVYKDHVDKNGTGTFLMWHWR
jgi:hypothetical protein